LIEFYFFNNWFCEAIFAFWYCFDTFLDFFRINYHTALIIKFFLFLRIAIISIEDEKG